ncbi:hypothetical protein RFI_36102, partial [Reticulomyxa filosa]
IVLLHNVPALEDYVTQLIKKTPDGGLLYGDVKKSEYSRLDLQVVVSSSNLQHNDEKTVDEIIFENVLEKNIYFSDLLAHTFSGNFQILFVYFAVDISEQLIQLANNFNIKNGQIEQKESKDENQRITMRPRCDIYSKTFAAEQKKKREEAVINPEINKVKMK